ncbi:hypothetical protein N7470_010074 [Penicillium chermesinum]|nr:hypothetical protein N7470_010074 [Penicillium chermesinum]
MSSRWERSTSFPSTPEEVKPLTPTIASSNPNSWQPRPGLSEAASSQVISGPGRAEELGKGKPTAYINNSREKGKEKEIDEDDNDPYQDPDNEVGLFSKAPYDADDAEADRIRGYDRGKIN